MRRKYIEERLGCPTLFGKDIETGVSCLDMGTLFVTCRTEEQAVALHAKLEGLLDFISDMADAFQECDAKAFTSFYYVKSRLAEKPKDLTLLVHAEDYPHSSTPSIERT